MNDRPPVERFERLLGTFPLPQSARSSLFADIVSVAGQRIHLAGLSADFLGECLTGSAGDPRATPVERAYMELLERISVVDASARGRTWAIVGADGECRATAASRDVFPKPPPGSAWAWSRSNGVAIGRTLAEAASHAYAELIERDRVLRSWFGGPAPRAIPLPDGSLPAEFRAAFDVRSVELEEEGRPGQLRVAGVLAFPRGEGPFAYGFGAAGDIEAAVSRALVECLQGIGFLWGEELPSGPPRAAPTPAFHQEYYLLRRHQVQVRRWLDGEHVRHAGLLQDPGWCGAPAFADITPPWLAPGLCVVKALPAGHVPLSFGPGHPYLVREPPSELAVHPIA